MNQMEKITARIKTLDWTEGDVYGMDFRMSGNSPAVRIDWGDGCVKTYYGNDIEATHIYHKGADYIYMVEASVLSGMIDYANPTGGDCEFQLLDFSKAPSIREIFVEIPHEVILDNPNLTKLTLRINKGYQYDFSRCPNLTYLSLSGGYNCSQLNLSQNHKLETLIWGYWGANPRKITVANDAPLKFVDIEGYDGLLPGCLAALRRILERNGGHMREELL